MQSIMHSCVICTVGVAVADHIFAVHLCEDIQTANLGRLVDYSDIKMLIMRCDRDAGRVGAWLLLMSSPEYTRFV